MNWPLRTVPPRFTLATTPAQFEAIAALAREIWTAHYTPIIGSAQVEYMLGKFQSAGAIAQQIQAENYHYFLMETQGAAIGYFAVQPREQTLFLSKYYVHADWRGQGFGRQAMTRIIELAQEWHKPTITLTVNRHNNAAIAAYRKLGFEMIGPVKTDIGQGFLMDDFCLEKRF